MDKLSPGLTFLKRLNDFFGNSSYDSVLIVLLLVLPGLITTVFLLFFKSSSNSSHKPKTSDEDKSMEFFEIVRLQKGLEEFDREFLLETAEKYGCRPAYKILIERDMFNMVEKSFFKQIEDRGESPENDRRFQHFLRLKLKLFS